MCTLVSNLLPIWCDSVANADKRGATFTQSQSVPLTFIQAQQSCSYCSERIHSTIYFVIDTYYARTNLYTLIYTLRGTHTYSIQITYQLVCNCVPIRQRVGVQLCNSVAANLCRARNRCPIVCNLIPISYQFVANCERSTGWLQVW